MIKQLQEELKTAKEENEKLKNQNKLFKGTIKKFNLDWYGEELDTLTQQNKQMREYIGKAEDIARTYQDYRPCLLIKKELQQALKELEE